MSQPDTKIPLVASLFLVILGLLIAAISGFSSGSLAGGLVAGLGIIPACWCMWVGMQGKTQAGLLYGILALFLSLGVAGILILLKFVDWLR